MNCWLLFTAKDDAAGETTIELKFTAAPLTVRVALDFKLMVDCAVMLTVPGPNPVAIPLEEIVAMLASEESQRTVLVMSLLVPSDMCAVAVNCCPEPVPIDIDCGVTWIEEIVGCPELFDEPLLAPHPISVDVTRTRATHSAFLITTPVTAKIFAGLNPGECKTILWGSFRETIKIGNVGRYRGNEM